MKYTHESFQVMPPEKGWEDTFNAPRPGRGRSRFNAETGQWVPVDTESRRSAREGRGDNEGGQRCKDDLFGAAVRGVLATRGVLE